MPSNRGGIGRRFHTKSAYRKDPREQGALTYWRAQHRQTSRDAERIQGSKHSYPGERSQTDKSGLGKNLRIQVSEVRFYLLWTQSEDGGRQKQMDKGGARKESERVKVGEGQVRRERE